MLGTLFGRCPVCGNKSIKKELLLARKETLPEFKKIKEQFLRRLDGYFKTEEPHGQVFRGAVAETVKSCETSEQEDRSEPVQNAVAPNIPSRVYIYRCNRCFFESTKYAYFHNLSLPEHINSSLFLSYREPDCHEDSVRSSIRGTVTELYEIPYESFYTVKTELYNSIVDARLKQIEEKASKAIEHNSRGLMLYNEGKYDEAIEAYKKAIEWDPALASAYNNLGLTYLELGNRDLSLENYKKSIEIRPDYAITYYNLACTYRAFGQYEEAVEHYKKAIELSPDDSSIHNDLGYTYYLMEKYEESIAQYTLAMELNEDGMIRNNLGLVYYRQGRIDDAFVEYKRPFI